MSAFIVPENVMANIIYNLFWNHEFKRSYGHNLFERKGYNTDKDFDRLAKELYIMNQDAIDARYGDTDDGYADIPKQVNWDKGTLDKFQTLKSMKCLRYQCSEGNIPETELYKWLDEVITCWMTYMLDEMPEYEKAVWA